MQGLTHCSLLPGKFGHCQAVPGMGNSRGAKRNEIHASFRLEFACEPLDLFVFPCLEVPSGPTATLILLPSAWDR